MIRRSALMSPVLAGALIILILAATYVLVSNNRRAVETDADTTTESSAPPEATPTATATPASAAEDVEGELKEVDADVVDLLENELSEDALSDTSLGL